LRVAGGLIVAAAGWELLKEDAKKTAEEPAAEERQADYTPHAFYPLTLPLTTGPGTIAVMISLGLSRSAYSAQDLGFYVASLLATVAMAIAIYVCFAYSDRVEQLLGRGGTNIAVRLSAFILFCLGIQIIWTGASDLLAGVFAPASVAK